MKPLMRRVFVVLISLITLGMYIPPTHIDTEAAQKKELSESNHVKETAGSTTEEERKEDEIDLDIGAMDGSPPSDLLIEALTEQAKEQTITKMGPRIIQKVDEDMTEEILPKLEEVIQEILTSSSEEDVPYYEITEELIPGYGEKIFNLYNYRTNEKIAKFHVRRDKRPGEGYWFNFHYHLHDDDFVKHHTIGEIYWEKNTPPKWMS